MLCIKTHITASNHTRLILKEVIVDNHTILYSIIIPNLAAVGNLDNFARATKRAYKCPSIVENKKKIMCNLHFFVIFLFLPGRLKQKFKAS